MAIASLSSGAAGISLHDVVAVLVARVTRGSRSVSPVTEAIVWDIRAPRVMLGAIVGGALASAGAAYQGALRNPLADPYLLGAAAGAGLGATVAVTAAAESWVQPLAFLGALLGVGATVALGSVVDLRRSATTILLAGVAVSSFLTAAQTLVLQLHRESLQVVYGWILGRVATGGWDDVRHILPPVVVGAAIVVSQARRLDALSLGDAKAESLGVRVARTRAITILGASMLTAGAVASCGLVGFVGLVVPHMARRAATGNRGIVGIAFLGGAFLLMTCDLVARTIMAPAELPLGAITAFIGAPFFAAILWSRSRAA